MLRVVVVEDEFYVRKGIIQTFDWKSLDCGIVGEAANGRDGIGVIEETKPDVVIADIEMPVVDGIEMVRILKSKQCRAQFIFLTAHQKFTYVHSALKLEAVDYLLKPFHYDDLKECIRKVRLKLNRPLQEEQERVLLTEQEVQAENEYIKKAVTYVRDHYQGELKVTDVAEYLGFSDSNYFSMTFKKIMGLSPRDYQEAKGH